MWVDTHCHLDAAEFAPDAVAERALAAARGVRMCVIPAVEVANFAAVRTLAHAGADSYCLGIHPLYVAQASEGDLAVLEDALQQHHTDPRLVAVGEIGLDYFEPALCQSPLREKQEYFFQAQLRLARQAELPVVLHVRRSVDRVLKGLRDCARQGPRWSGIAHAFNGSDVQAQAMLAQGLRLGFGGALTYERATRLRHLAATLPASALVLETDAPDIPPHWLYSSQAQRQNGARQGRNSPAEVPAIGLVLAQLRNITVQQLSLECTRNAVEALPRLAALLV